MAYLTNFLINCFSVIKMVLAILVFLPCFERRGQFLVRCLCCLSFSLIVIAVTSLLSEEVLGVELPVVVTIFVHIIYSLCSVIWLAVCFKGKPMAYFFHVFSALMLYAVLSGARELFFSIGRGETGDGTIVPDSIWDFLLQIGLMAVLYGGAYLLLQEGLRNYRNIEIETRSFLICALSGIVLALINVSATAIKYDYPFYSNMLFLCSIVYGFLMLYMQYNTFLLWRLGIQRDRERQARESAEHLSRESLRQYNVLKQNIDIINVKCHDMKHILQSARTAGASEQYFAALEKSIDIYDCTVKTDNEVLDVILTELKLRCNAAGIQLACMADGRAIAFMETSDIFSMFGNIVDNAVEYLTQVEEECRFMRLTVARQKDFLLIREENYFCGVLETGADGTIKTSKSDRINHGYGIKSIRMAAEKYGGTVTVAAENGLFSACVLIPQPTAAAAGRTS